ncbi:TrmB family transcriptional regulator [Prauserella shujinwangii]|uniref:TrmB family transcriptional regulator n=1 Tax=Prauserella shujinwangii TaxID=1453103 RepID=A0A2T0M3F9_9PSEU|nr:MarR family transcriptional regulator [Prauserella shujinwangii]PRX51278.1 TrmB family transcriptional regulator [Prauserella shujinwangii]
MAGPMDAAERMALTLTRNGMQRMTARVLCALLFADQETITAGEIAERLGVSAGSVSGALKMLQPVGLIERVPVPGSRREHYRFPDDGWPTLMSAQNEVVGAMLRAAEEGVESTGEDSVAGRRLAEMRDFYRYLLRELPRLMDVWRAERGLPREE